MCSATSVVSAELTKLIVHHPDQDPDALASVGAH